MAAKKSTTTKKATRKTAKPSASLKAAAKKTGAKKATAKKPAAKKSIYSRLAGYEDTNDAERLCVDPAMRRVVGGTGH